MDNSTISQIAKLHPKLRGEVSTIVSEISAKGVEIRIVQGLRTFAEQDALYAQGRTNMNKPKVTNAKGGESYHNFGLSIDFCLLHKGGGISWDMSEDIDNDGQKDWLEVVNVFESHGWSWGGRWKHPDNPHFEKTFGFNFLQLGKMAKDTNGYVLLP